MNPDECVRGSAAARVCKLGEPVITRSSCNVHSIFCLRAPAKALLDGHIKPMGRMSATVFGLFCGLGSQLIYASAQSSSAIGVVPAAKCRQRAGPSTVEISAEHNFQTAVRATQAPSVEQQAPRC